MRAEADAPSELNSSAMRRILASSFIGTAIEYYDFILYATAASLVFGQVFFANLGPGLGLLASFATLAVGYLVRPLGGVIFGHFGDTVGRKKMLIISMTMMGVATTTIGLLPGSDQIGQLAPLLLIMLRIVQGVAVGGEWGGAALMAMEHGPKNRRGLSTSFANAGGPAGAILATLVVAVMVPLSGDGFLSWGWRVPFLLSVVLIAVGMVIRLKVAESPQFEQLAEKAKQKKIPLLTVLRRQPKALLVTLLACSGFYYVQSLITVWGLSVVSARGADPGPILVMKAVAACLLLITTFYFANLSDKLGRRPVLIAGAIAAAVLIYPLLLLIDTGNSWAYLVVLLIGNGLIQGCLYGPIGAFTAERFPPETRYTGASLAYQGASTLGAGFTPVIASSLVLAAGGGMWLLGLFSAVVMAIVGWCVFVTTEAVVKEPPEIRHAAVDGAEGRV